MELEFSMIKAFTTCTHAGLLNLTIMLNVNSTCWEQTPSIEDTLSIVDKGHGTKVSTNKGVGCNPAEYQIAYSM